MTTLLPLLERESRRRSLATADEPLTAAAYFTPIRNMPHRRASSRHPEAIIREWRDTCSGKHCASDRILGELGRRSRVIMCTHRFTWDNARHFPVSTPGVCQGNPRLPPRTASGSQKVSEEVRIVRIARSRLTCFMWAYGTMAPLAIVFLVTVGIACTGTGVAPQSETAVVAEAPEPTPPRPPLTA